MRDKYRRAKGLIDNQRIPTKTKKVADLSDLVVTVLEIGENTYWTSGPVKLQFIQSQ